MTGAIGQFAISETGLDLSTPDRFKQLLNEPEIDLVYLIEFSPYDSTVSNTVQGVGISTNAIGDFGFNYKGSVVTLRYSDVGFYTSPSDTPANTSYKPVTNNAFQFDISVFNGEFSGRPASFGAIRILNGDGDYDEILDYNWIGRNVKVLVGTKDFTYNQFVKVFDGIASGLEYSEDEIIVNIQNNDRVLETEFVQVRYEGTGGLDGGADIEGIVKPLLYGEALRLTPVLVDAANLIYQIHDGSMQSVDAVYDRGVALTNGGDVADITTATPSASQFITQLSGGYIKLGSSPDGQITVDAKGDNTGGYINLSGQIISRLIRTKLGLFNFTSSQIDQGALNTLDNQITGKVGIYLSDVTNVQTILNDLLTPLQAYWLFDRQGALTVDFADVPGQSLLTFTESDIIDNEIEVIQTYSPTWRISVGYARRLTNQQEIASAASDAYRSFNEEEYRVIVNENRNIRRAAATAVEKKYDTALVDKVDAEALTQRLVNVYSEVRKVYRVRVTNLLFRVFIGDTVTLQLNRFGLSSGKKFVIVSISEDAETGETELELWG